MVKCIQGTWKEDTTMNFTDQKRQTINGSISHATQTWYSFTAATNTVPMKPQKVFSPSQWCSWVCHSSRICHHVTGWLVQHPRRMANSSLRSYKMPCINILITTSRSRCNNLRLAKWIFLILLGIRSNICWHIPILVKIKCKALHTIMGITGAWHTNVYCNNPSREGLNWLAIELLAGILITAETWVGHCDPNKKRLHRTAHKSLPSTAEL